MNADTIANEAIAARIAGRDILFSIPPADLPIFEAVLRKPAYAMFAALLRGEWTVADIRAVLMFAASPHGVSEQDRKIFETLGLAPSQRLRKLSDDELHVAATLNAKPPAKYAVLAKQILAATLFGAAGKDDLIFTDEDADA